jgi:hypothetical protein
LGGGMDRKHTQVTGPPARAVLKSSKLAWRGVDVEIAKGISSMAC